MNIVIAYHNTPCMIMTLYYSFNNTIADGSYPDIINPSLPLQAPIDDHVQAAMVNT